MSTEQTSGAGGVTLRWTGDAGLTDEQRQRILGPGAPFELVEEDVLGTRLLTFARRLRSTRDALVEGGARYGDRPYLVFPDRELSFAGVLEPVAAVAAALQQRYGVGPGDRVAVIAPNCAPHALVAWAAVCLGAISVELNGWWTGPEIEYGVNLTQPKVLFGDARRLERIDRASLGIPVVCFEEEFADLEREGAGAEMPSVTMDEDDPMVIMFTSGTTGRPKGATLSHRNHIHMAMQNQLSGAIGAARLAAAIGEEAAAASAAAQPPPATLGVAPLFHVSGFSVHLIGGPLNGTSVVYPPPGRWQEEVHLEYTQRYRPSRWSLVPTQLWRLLEHPRLHEYDISSVIGIGGGSATWDPEMIRQVGLRMPGVKRVGMGYGLTETTGGGTNHDGDVVIAFPGSVGRPVPGAEIQIRSAGGGDTALPEGEIGEVCLRSAMNFLGYWGNAEATAACLDADRWFRTGDFGRINDGLLFLESRRSDLIIRGGENVYPVEIENRLMEHPDIVEVAVVGVEHRTLGQEVKAFVVARAGSNLTEDDVRAWAGATLAAFKVPSQVTFLEEMPHNATGKVMKHLLLEGAVSGFTEE